MMVKGEGCSGGVGTDGGLGRIMSVLTKIA